MDNNPYGWTFGIITDGTQDARIDKIIDSIETQAIPNCVYEIIIVGNSKVSRQNTKVIPFDESVKPKWITRKKNLIAQQAKFNKIAMLHDYVAFQSGWYNGFLEFGDNWDVAMNRVENLDGSRFLDWIATNPLWLKLDYSDHSQTKHNMYVSGTFFCVKKDFMLKYPFNENLVWGQAEDVEWSVISRPFWNYRCNAKSVVRLLKQHG